MKIYIAGPVSGLPNYNRPAFDECESKLISLGYEVVNPHKICDCLDPTFDSHADYMKICLHGLLDCDAIVFLDGYQDSKGSKIEAIVALHTGIQRVELSTLEQYVEE